MESAIEIRPAGLDDFDAILRLWTDSGLSIRPGGRDRREAFTRQLAAFPATYLVAEIDGRVVGAVLGTHDERKGWINRLAVHPEVRRRGIATHLIQACEQALLAEGIEIFAALVEIENEVSTDVFDRNGYRRDIPVHYFHKRLRADV